MLGKMKRRAIWAEAYRKLATLREAKEERERRAHLHTVRTVAYYEGDLYMLRTSQGQVFKALKIDENWPYHCTVYAGHRSWKIASKYIIGITKLRFKDPVAVFYEDGYDIRLLEDPSSFDLHTVYEVEYESDMKPRALKPTNVLFDPSAPSLWDRQAKFNAELIEHNDAQFTGEF